MSKRNRGAYLKWVKERKCWYVVWFEGGSIRKKSTGSGNRQEADQALTKHILDHEKTTDPTRLDQRLLADVLAAYAEEHAVHVKSCATIGFNIQSLLPFWGEKMVADARPTLCREYVKWRIQKAALKGRKVSEVTAGRELGVLAAAINHDYKQGRLVSNVYVWKPAPAAPKDRWLSRNEVAHLLRTARASKRFNTAKGKLRTHSFSRWHLSLFILVALYTAARKEAIVTLQWSQVDLERGIIDLNKPGDKITNKRRAIVPIPCNLMTFLRIAKKRRSENGYVIEYYGRSIERIDQSFRRIVRDAGLVNVTPHTLRHTAATWMAQAGTPMWIISKYLGHTSTRTTEKIYAHHNPSFLLEAKRALEGGTKIRKEAGENPKRENIETTSIKRDKNPALTF